MEASTCLGIEEDVARLLEDFERRVSWVSSVRFATLIIVLRSGRMVDRDYRVAERSWCREGMRLRLLYMLGSDICRSESEVAMSEISFEIVEVFVWEDDM